MAEITKGDTPSLTTPLPSDTDRLPPLYAGEAIAAGDACRVHSDNKVYRTDGTGTGTFATTAQVAGFALKATAIGEKVSLYSHCDIAYAAGLTPGTFVYPSGTVKGGLATAPGSVQPQPCGYVLPADAPDTRQRIRVFPTFAAAFPSS
jgi:hypothetical protein